MNPYSFKRFLENPGRPRHPIQLVQTGSNRIIVQGDLPDCVRNGDTGFLTTDEPSPLPDTIGSTYHQESHRNSLRATLLDDPDISIGRTLVATVGIHSNEGPHSVCQSHSRSHIPDIHLCTSANTRSNPTLDTCPTLPGAEPDEHVTHIDSRGLPDFLPHRFVGTEVDETSVCSHPPSLTVVGQSMPLHCSSLPSLLFGIIESQVQRIPTSSRSFEQLSVQANENKSTVTCTDRGVLFPDGPNSKQMQTDQATESGDHWSSHTMPSSSQSDPFVDARPVSLSDSVASPDLRFIAQQERIEMLTVRLDETERELRETRRLLRQQKQLLYSIRAESEVVRREAEVRVKELEHELAAERLRSAKDRLFVVQLREQLASVRQNVRQQSPTDLSPCSSVLHSDGSSEHVCSPRTVVAQPLQTHGDRSAVVVRPNIVTGTGRMGAENPSLPNFPNPMPLSHKANLSAAPP
ncbi:hypothetical protein D915_006856 [Fasciola hepatica]|uniref:Uncharacterized protein n=1 Tax=Fasciola hepatica TaxID=6192 RepID=A0A4E0R5X4_FASHE|nr:hypothetical protein D915_006856 [Fasciola hepatica]